MQDVVRTILIAALVTLCHAAAADSVGDGVAAYERQDYTVALQLLKPSAESGNAYAQTVLGFMFEEGHGVRQDYVEAVKWIGLAANQNFPLAQKELGLLYFNGRGVSKDYAECARWWRKAADQGYDDAQYSLAVLYATGLGVPKDFVLAYMWYNLAAAQGYPKAGEGRTSVSDQMTPDQIAEAQRLTREWKPTK